MLLKETGALAICLAKLEAGNLAVESPTNKSVRWQLTNQTKVLQKLGWAAC